MAKKIKLKPGQALKKTVLASKTPSHMHPYSAARMVEDAKDDPDLDVRTRRRLQDRWTISKVDAMATDAILEHLRALGHDLGEADFRRLVADHRSAWEASPALNAPRSRDDDDFVGLAFCTLWRRWLPERPSVEMIDDWIVEGYYCSEEHHHDEGLTTWRRAWDALRGRLDATVTTTSAAERAAFPGFTSLFNWTQDYVQEHIHVSPGYVDAGIQLVDELLAQFVGETPTYRQNLAADKVAIYEIAERFDEAEHAAQAVIDAWPKNAIGYATLADIVRKRNRHDDAIAVIERALAVPVVDAREFEMKLRLKDLRGERSP
jgi:tetratricopeptide (TPR) repeat protein